MLAILQESVQNRLVLPLVIATPQHHRVLYPDATAGQVEARLRKSATEVQALSVCVEHICRPAFFEVRGHLHERGKQELVELVPLHRVILDG